MDESESGEVVCECCNTTCPDEDALEYRRTSIIDGRLGSPYWLCIPCNNACADSWECRVLEEREEFQWRWERRPVTDDELSEVADMVERSIRRQLGLNVRLNSEEESCPVSSTG